MTAKHLLYVVLAGGLGSGARFLVTSFVLGRLGPAFPWGTLVVNVVGSFLACLVMELGLAGDLVGREARLVLTTGFLGGFTTYSTFNFETVRLLQDGSWGVAILNATSTFGTCLLAGLLGVGAARLVTGG